MTYSKCIQDIEVALGQGITKKVQGSIKFIKKINKATAFKARQLFFI